MITTVCHHLSPNGLCVRCVDTVKPSSRISDSICVLTHSRALIAIRTKKKTAASSKPNKNGTVSPAEQRWGPPENDTFVATWAAYRANQKKRQAEGKSSANLGPPMRDRNRFAPNTQLHDTIIMTFIFFISAFTRATGGTSCIVSSPIRIFTSYHDDGRFPRFTTSCLQKETPHEQCIHQHSTCGRVTKRSRLGTNVSTTGDKDSRRGDSGIGHDDETHGRSSDVRGAIATSTPSQVTTPIPATIISHELPRTER